MAAFPPGRKFDFPRIFWEYFELELLKMKCSAIKMVGNKWFPIWISKGFIFPPSGSFYGSVSPSQHSFFLFQRAGISDGDALMDLIPIIL